MRCCSGEFEALVLFQKVNIEISGRIDPILVNFYRQGSDQSEATRFVRKDPDYVSAPFDFLV
jgi:hypothetical protein